FPPPWPKTTGRRRAWQRKCSSLPGPMCWCAGWTRKPPRCERRDAAVKYTLSVLVENQPGVLSKVVSLFARRGYNIDSLAVGTTEDTTMSRMTIVGQGDDHILEQVEKQLNKVIPVI